MSYRKLMAGVLLLCLSWMARAGDFLPVEQAFVFSARQQGANTIALHWAVAPGYHLYRDRLSVEAEAQPPLRFKPDALPAGQQVFDANFNKRLEVYQQPVAWTLQVLEGASSGILNVQWQGCAEAGLCYPPVSSRIKVSLKSLGASTDQVEIMSDVDADAGRPASAVGAMGGAMAKDPDMIAAALASGSFLQTALVFGLAGLLLSFTPCVLPMVPILSSLIAGQAGPVSRRRGFSLSLSYALGMSLVYAGFGVAAGLAGEGLAAALQNPWVLGAFALLLSVFALSMFGVYELQMPAGIQGRAMQWSNRFQGGSLLGVFLMGGVSALVVGPCVAAPLAGALIYISQTRDVWLGGMALFVMALGMSVPLLLVGISAGSLLPRAGAWMERVKQLFGMMLLAVAVWMVSPVLPASLPLLLWAFWLLGAAALLGLFGAASGQTVGVAGRASGAALATMALVLLVGAASGGQSVLQPLQHWARASGGTGGTGANDKPGAAAGLAFERVNNLAQLEAALQQAQQRGQSVMLDFYADWCVACKELEHFTFSRPEIQQRLTSVRLLQADVTNNLAEHKALLKRFGLFGPPGIVFFDGRQQAAVTHKVIGFQGPEEFMVSLGKGLQ